MTTSCKILLEITLSLLSIWLLACMVNPTALQGQYNPLQFTHLTLDNGLPSMKVYDLAQDKQGFIWIATEAGIARFDGYEFQNYTSIDGLPNNEVVNIYPDSKGRIWLGGLGALCYYDGKDFHKLVNEISSYNFLGLSIRETSHGDFWAAWNGNLIHIGQNLSLLPHQWEDEFKTHGSLSIVDLVHDSLWIRYRGEIFVLDTQRETLEQIPLKHPAPVDKFSFFADLYCNRLYYSSEEGIVVRDLATKIEKVVLPEKRQFRSLKIHQGYLWISTFGIGIEKILINPDGTLANERVKIIGDQNTREMFWDQEGNIWIPSLGNGIFFYPSAAEKMQIFTVEEGMKSSKVESILCQGDSLWIGNDLSGISLIQNGFIESFPVYNLRPRPLNRVLKIGLLPSGALLLATDLGLIRWTPTKSQTLFDTSGKSFYLSDDNQLAFTTYHGAYLTQISFLDRDGITFGAPNCVAGVEQLYEDRAYGIIIDHQGDVWLGSTNRGLIQIHEGKKIFWDEKSPIFSGVIKEMLLLPDSSLVLATNGNGVIFVKDSAYFQLTTKNGLPSNVCNDLSMDEGWLWISHNRGISGIHSPRFSHQSPDIEVYTKKDGLITNEIEAIATCGEDIIIGSHQGVLIVNKSDLTERSTMPTLQFTDYWVNGERIAPKELLDLAPEENNLRFKFSGLSFSNQQNIQYQYRLVGGTDQWQNTRTREIQLSNISPGKYTLELRIVQEGILGETQRIPFYIRSHFYETGWFQLLMGGFIFMMAGIGIFSLYMAKQRRELERIVKKKTATLNEKLLDLAAVNQQLEFSNRELEQFAHVASHDLKAPLRNVSSFIQILEATAGNKLNDKEREFLRYAIKGSRRMNEIINDLLELAKVDRMGEERQRIDFKKVIIETLDLLKLEIEQKGAQIEIEGEFPKLLFNKTNARRVFENLISNALKYQGENQPKINIGCRRKNNMWLFFVQDNGIGIDPKYQQKVFQLFQRLHSENAYSGTGLGLAICKKIVEKKHGQIWFESNEGPGVTFYFTLPNH